MNTRWPTSVPDYRWPRRIASHEMAPLRWTMAAVFHCAHALGRAWRFAVDRVSDYARLNRPTLVIRTDGIGDALLFEPALESLARTASPSEIHLWAPRGACELMRECPCLTRRLTIPRGGKSGNLTYFFSFYWRAKLGFELGRWVFDTVIYPCESPEPLGNWIFVNARANQRWINSGDTINQFEEQRFAAHSAATRVLESRPGNGHELQRNAYLADQWAEEPRLRRPRVHLHRDVLERASQMSSAWRRAAVRAGAEELIGLVAGGTSAVNHYPLDRWAVVLERLWDQRRAIAVLLGGPEDRRALDRIESQLKRVPHLRAKHTLGLPVLLGTMRGLDGVLTIDTGLAHAALAQRLPTVVLVGGGNPGRFFPWPNNRDHAALNVAMPCEGCNNRCTQPEPRCITDITPDEIVNAYVNLQHRRTKLSPFVTVIPPAQLPARVAG